MRRPFPTSAPAIHWVWLLRVMRGATVEEVATLYGEQPAAVRGAIGYLGAEIERPTIIPAIPIGNTVPLRRSGGSKPHRSTPGARVVSRFGIRYRSDGA
jgi:hypothetical protein